MSKVRQDDTSIYVICDGMKARPGAVVGYDHAFDMGSGGLKAGDTVKARHISGTPLTKITTEDKRKLHWHRYPCS